MSEGAYYVILLAIASVFGLRGSWRLTQRFRAVAFGEGRLTPSERLLLGTLVAIAWFLTTVAVYLGVLSVRRLLGMEPLGFTAPITAVLAMMILLIPAAIDVVVTHIASGRS